MAALLDCEPENLGKMLYHSVEKPVAPVEFQGAPPCQEVVHLATDPDFDLNRLVPAPTNTPDDAGPYITLGMCYASHPDTGLHDVTIHRLCIQGKDELSIFFTPGATPYRRDGRPCGGAWPETADFHQHRRRILRLRSVPALSRRQHRLVTMSFRLQVRCGKSRWNCAIAFR